MLNLKELESKLDTVLELETESSLTNWILKKRIKEYINSPGQGEWKSFESIKSSFISITYNIFESLDDGIGSGDPYRIAA
ncbi:MAG: hypothetical protein ABIR66_07270 [Saprospiraceae bacterium]